VTATSLRGTGRQADATADGCRCQFLLDYIAIRELTAKYNHAWDDGKPQEWADTFTADGEMVAPPVLAVAGRDALVAVVRQAGTGVVHATTDPVITIDGDEAHQSCTVIIGSGKGTAKRIDLSMTGRYADTLVRTADGWRFKRREVTLDRVGRRPRADQGDGER
jgi:uncharacterized protein (TIGR02246 family)